ncbi:MAG: Glu/Leu/Phe/Val dehydrogenase [Bacteroidales bacterium]|nr:Glu/Leu/Phe/Val dehydrogenase [Bacteroidales bacterium]
MESKSYNPFLFAQKQFDNAADLLELNDATREFLRTPMREFHFTIPVRMDDGTKKIFKAFRIVHNDARGPAKGGIRFHPMETVDIIRAMSMWMTWKTSVADIPLGGSKGGVICDPHHLSMYEQEQISRGWVRQIIGNIGPHIDIPAPEMMTNSQHMIWMLDEFEKITGVKSPGAFTGKPISLGGSFGRKEASGYGVMITIREALKELNIKPMNTVASFQGFGNVAQHAIDLYQKMGGITKCVSFWDNEDQKSYTVCKKNGIKLKELQKITDTFGGINKEKAHELGYEILDGDAWLEQEVDILVPAAIENQLTEDNVGKIHSKVKIIAEGANGPTTPDADEILNKTNILILPDFLTNAGGVICSYFEQVQNNMNYYWSKDEILSKLDEKMSTAYAAVSDFAKENSLNMRQAAYVISVDRVVQACRMRGWI